MAACGCRGAAPPRQQRQAEASRAASPGKPPRTWRNPSQTVALVSPECPAGGCARGVRGHEGCGGCGGHREFATYPLRDPPAAPLPAARQPPSPCNRFSGFLEALEAARRPIPPLPPPPTALAPRESDRGAREARRRRRRCRGCDNDRESDANHFPPSRLSLFFSAPKTGRRKFPSADTRDQLRRR